jgi:signal transduction histidine kinase
MMLKILISIDAGLLGFFGIIKAFASSYSPGEVERGQFSYSWYDLPFTFLGQSLLVLAIILFQVNNLLLIGARRKLGLWLAVGNLMLAITAFIHGSGQGNDWILLLAPLAMAVALAWASLWPLNSEEAAAELASLEVPDDVREALLRQFREATAQEERNRLARDLHDSIKQQLFSINVGTATIQERWERDPEGARAALQDVRKSAKAAMVEMQAMLHQLRPKALGSAGLIEALREQCEALGYRTGSEVIFEVGEILTDDRMPPGAQETLFRIAQEALGNVARHARARRVRVRLGREGDAACLQVEDDGQGFEIGAENPGMGLRNIKERTEPFGGTLDVVSTPGVGTAVRVAIPLLSLPVAFPEESSIKYEGLYLFFAGTYILGALLDPAEPKTGLFQTVWDALGVLILLMWTMTVARQVPPEVQRNEPVRLRYALHRLRAVLFFAVAVQAPWYQSLNEEGLRGTQLAWMVIALPCLGLALRELALFHRWSAWRQDWPPFLRSRRVVASLAMGGFVVVILNLILIKSGFSVPITLLLRHLELRWQSALLLLISALMTAYFFSRQCRMQGEGS